MEKLLLELAQVRYEELVKKYGKKSPRRRLIQGTH